MSLLHSVLVVRLRHPVEGEAAYLTLAEASGVSGQGTVSAPVMEAYHEIMSSKPEAIEARRTYSHLVLIVDNGMRANHEFPDLEARAASKARSAEIRDAAAREQAAATEAATLKKQLAEAEQRESSAASRLRSLTGKPAPSPTPEEGDQGAVETDSKEGTLAAAPLIDPETKDAASAPSGGETSSGDPVALVIARLESNEEVTPEELLVLTVEQLRSLGERYEIPMPAKATKPDLVELLLQKEE